MSLRQLISCLSLLLSPLVVAHDAWIETEGPAYPIIYGHSDGGEPYDPAKIQKISAYGADGNVIEVALERSADGAKVVPGGEVVMLTLDFDNGFWSRVDGKSRNESKKITGAEEGSQSLKFGKTILSWTEQVTRPAGQVLEIIPRVSDLTQHNGSMEVQVLYNGEPLAGARVRAGGGHGDEPLLSNTQGIVSVPVVPGVQLITASHRIPFSGPEADVSNLSASLRFAAP